MYRIAGTFSVMQTKAGPALGASATDSLAPQYPVESVDKALKLLLLGEQPEIRLSQATRYLGVASSTAHRLRLAINSAESNCPALPRKRASR
jgi:hypothetical protein